MTSIKLPYGKEQVTLEVPNERLKAVLVSELHHYTPEGSQVDFTKAVT